MPLPQLAYTATTASTAVTGALSNATVANLTAVADAQSVPLAGITASFGLTCAGDSRGSTVAILHL